MPACNTQHELFKKNAPSLRMSLSSSAMSSGPNTSARCSGHASSSICSSSSKTRNGGTAKGVCATHSECTHSANELCWRRTAAFRRVCERVHAHRLAVRCCRPSDARCSCDDVAWTCVARWLCVCVCVRQGCRRLFLVAVVVMTEGGGHSPP